MPDSVPMQQQVVREYTEECRHPLGEPRCRLLDVSNQQQQQHPDHDQSPFK